MKIVVMLAPCSAPTSLRAGDVRCATMLRHGTEGGSVNA
jgi:hypothetical protein